MTALTVTEFDDSGIGVWSDPETFEVTRERIADYAAATNDPIAAHLAGDVASPVFAIVPAFESLMAPAIDVVPMSIFGKLVHGEQDFHFHRPISPGDVLTARGKVIGYDRVDSGSRLNIYLETRDAQGELVNEQYVLAFFRGIDTGKDEGQQVPAHSLSDEVRASEPLARVDQHVDDDQTFRYAPASGDPMPIHLDDEVAKNAGLPGIIAHGLCTMAFTSWAVLTEVGQSDVTRLRRFAVRFSKMVLPGDDLETRIWKLTDAADAADAVGPADAPTTSYGFEAARGNELVITDGLAVFAN